MERLNAESAVLAIRELHGERVTEAYIKLMNDARFSDKEMAAALSLVCAVFAIDAVERTKKSNALG